MQNEERINGLETQVRTLKRIVYGFGCLLVAGVIVSATSLQTVPDVIQAKKFQVVNDEGEVVAELGANEEGGTLRIDKNGGIRGAFLGVYENGGLFGIFNKDGKPSVALGADENGGGLSIRNKDVIKVAGIGADENGGWLRIRNYNGQKVAGIGADENGGVLATFNKKGEVTSHTPSKLDASEFPVVKPESDFQFRVGFQNTNFNNYDYALIVDFDKHKVPSGKRVRVSVVDPITKRVWVDQVFSSSQIASPTRPSYKGSLVILYKGMSLESSGILESLQHLIDGTNSLDERLPDIKEQVYFTGRMVNQIELEWVEIDFVD